MEVYCRGTAWIRHSATGDIYIIESDDLDWDAVRSDERQLGPEIQYEAVVEHPQLGRLTWGLWEYPVGAERYNNTDAGPHEVIADFDYGLDQVEPELDEWLDYPIPDDPFAFFMNSYYQTRDLLAHHGEDGGDQLLNRMLFSQQVTALEAYLGDTLMKAVEDDPDARQRLIERDTGLAKEKFTLAEISSDPDLVDRKVRERLRSVLYHDLGKVNALYKLTLGFGILNLTSDRERLFKAVALRHDCVHRSGFDREGNEPTVFTKAFVQETANLIKDLVQMIEIEINGPGFD